MYTATDQTCQCHKFYTGIQRSKLPVYHRIRECYVPKTMYTATIQIFKFHEFYTGTQGSKLPVYNRIRGCCVSKTIYTATDQICQCHKFEKQERRVQATCLPQNQRMLCLYDNVHYYLPNLTISLFYTGMQGSKNQRVLCL